MGHFSYSSQIFLGMFIQKENATRLIMPLFSIFILTLGGSCHKKSKIITLIRKSGKLKNTCKNCFHQFSSYLNLRLFYTFSNRRNNIILDTQFLTFCNRTKTCYIKEQITILAMSIFKFENMFFKIFRNVELKPGPAKLQ